MHKLIVYVNALAMPERNKFAKGVGTSIGYMRKRASLGKTLNAQVCSMIEKVTKGAVTRQDLRPEDYWLIWPDLKAPKGKK